MTNDRKMGQTMYNSQHLQDILLEERCKENAFDVKSLKLYFSMKEKYTKYCRKSKRSFFIFYFQKKKKEKKKV